MSHSRRAYMAGMQADLHGVLLLMWSSTVPLVFYGFPCHPRLQAAYFALMSALAAACQAATLTPVFRDPALAHSRAGLFGSFAVVSFVLPLVNGVLLEGFGGFATRVGLGWIVMTGVLNSLAVAAYTSKVCSVPSRPVPFRSCEHYEPFPHRGLTATRFRRYGLPGASTCVVPATKSCTLWCWPPRLRTRRLSCTRLTSAMGRGGDSASWDGGHRCQSTYTPHNSR